MMVDSKATGAWGEIYAARYLLEKGYVIRSANYRTKNGEIDIIAEKGGNVISVHHERAGEGSDINGCFLRIVLETRNFAHIKEITDALSEAGYKLC